jgi:hypothetical protein
MTIRSRSERRTGAVYNALETGHCFNHAAKNTFGRDCLREKIDFTPLPPQIFVDYYYFVYLIGRLEFRVRDQCERRGLLVSTLFGEAVNMSTPR